MPTVSKCFSDACKSCSDACQCDCLNEFCAKPFAVTTSVALGLNGVPLLLGLYFGGSSVGSDCSQLGVWLLIQAVLSGGHMAMCIYFFQVMQKPYDLSDPKDRNFNTRIQHLVSVKATLCEPVRPIIVPDQRDSFSPSYLTKGESFIYSNYTLY